jgi:tripartite-type tricarboxylate transporter receptor subunit TctC
MRIQRRHALGLLATSALAQAPAWPQARPIRIIVPFPPGGATDIVARIAAQRLGPALGTQVVVENRPGAGGTLGTDLVAKAPPDGFSLLLSNIASNGVAAGVYRALPYNPSTDFTHIALLADTPSVLAVNVAGPWLTLADYLAAARRAGGVTIASPGNGSSSHVLGATLGRLAGVPLTHVPYRGSNPALTDLVAGQVDSAITTLAETMHNPRLRQLAITSAARMPVAPAIPTFAELGYPAMTAPTWFGLSGPAGLPDAIADRLHAECMEFLGAPEVVERLNALVALPGRLSRPAYQAFVAAEIRRWTEQARAANATAE